MCKDNIDEHILKISFKERCTSLPLIKHINEWILSLVINYARDGD